MKLTRRHFNAGLAWMRLRNQRAAIRAFRACLKLDPDHAAARHKLEALADPSGAQ